MTGATLVFLADSRFWLASAATRVCAAAVLPAKIVPCEPESLEHPSPRPTFDSPQAAIRELRRASTKKPREIPLQIPRGADYKRARPEGRAYDSTIDYCASRIRNASLLRGDRRQALVQEPLHAAALIGLDRVQVAL